MNKTLIWWKFLCVIAVIHIIAWSWAAAVHADMQQFSYVQPLLSGLYVLVCAFRSFFPRIDLERYCLIDSRYSSIVLGRSLATIAEICFSIQCALVLYDLGIHLHSPVITGIAYAVVPIIVLAQISCWYATLTLNHFWHGVEEALWIVMIILAAGCFAYGLMVLDGWLQLLMLLGIISCIGAAYIMLVIDIPMYLARSRKLSNKAHQYLSIAQGFRDALTRRVPTQDWKVWKPEVVWISSYFTVGVWLSIAMIFIRF